ncbi:acetyl-CoA C-acetyltransferase [bacterium]|nr:acetyl-CoA C-acetyltransferase [bacterium]
MKRVAILGGVRLPFCRMGTSYMDFSALDLQTEALKALVEKFHLRQERVGEVALGTVFQHPSIWNYAREAVLRSGLSPEVPGITVSRACATSLDAAFVIAQKIASGQIECGIAGGAESMSGVGLFIPQKLARRFVRTQGAKTFGQKFSIWKSLSLKELRVQGPAPEEPSSGLLMGNHCELMAQEWGITRADQDALSLASHQNGERAYQRGFYKDLIHPFNGIQKDNVLRGDTSAEKLAKLKPAFERSAKGTLTAGNSSPLTDGAACVFLASEEWAKQHGHEVQAYFTFCETAAVDIKKEGLLMAPAYAVPRMLQRANRKLQDFDFYEIHEAFAAQVLCTLKAWESERFFTERVKMPGPLGSIDRAKLNVVGGSVALGHPFGATGARIVATLAKLLQEKGSGRGLISVCTGGGMGTTAILER